MLLRCKACDAPLTKFVFLSNKDDNTCELEDLCPKCKHISYNYDYLMTKEYAYEHLTENWVNFRNNEENY